MVNWESGKRGTLPITESAACATLRKVRGRNTVMSCYFVGRCCAPASWNLRGREWGGADRVGRTTIRPARGWDAWDFQGRSLVRVVPMFHDCGGVATLGVESERRPMIDDQRWCCSGRSLNGKDNKLIPHVVSSVFCSIGRSQQPVLSTYSHTDDTSIT